ncbi:hypothetical protein [Falsibacillus pallidus]|uniref:hypothetical protein n=1 Tax=Falsibacillus pallidus TaxID=493781 RepID=UPI003D9735D6
MNHAIVFSAGGFIGFSLCRELLNRGYNVLAIEHTETMQISDESKWMEFGRNANFNFSSLEDWNGEGKEPFFCFIPYYDFLGEGYEERAGGIREKIIQNKSWFDKSIHQTMILRFISESRVDQDALPNEIPIPHSNLFLPTVFGPWQPKEFAYHKLLLDEREGLESTIDYQEPLKDAFFVDDIAAGIIDHAEKEGKKASLLLTTGEEGRWAEGLRHFGEEAAVDPYQSQKTSHLYKELVIKSSTTLEEGLQQQRTCIESLLKKRT